MSITQSVQAKPYPHISQQQSLPTPPTHFRETWRLNKHDFATLQQLSRKDRHAMYCTSRWGRKSGFASTHTHQNSRENTHGGTLLYLHCKRGAQNTAWCCGEGKGGRWGLVGTKHGLVLIVSLNRVINFFSSKSSLSYSSTLFAAFDATKRGRKQITQLCW